MKYFIDTEFIEGPQSTWWVGKTKPTIDLISIGIIREDTTTPNGLTVKQGYYAISKDFNLKEAWNRCDVQDRGIEGIRKNYWIRENVLRPIYYELCQRENPNLVEEGYNFKFRYKELKRLIEKYGKTNKQIAEEVKMFVYQDGIYSTPTPEIKNRQKDIEFYGYYSDYDWVVFCWLFGRMIDLPKGFPMYCIDLKQILDEKNSNAYLLSLLHVKDNLKNHPNYPKQFSEHSAWDDARWNYELYKFLNTL